MKIVADDKIPYIQGVLEPYASVVYLPGDSIRRDDLADADVLLTRSITLCDEDLLDGTSVRLIASATIGDDHIDKNFCAGAGIRWSVAAGCNAEAVNQYVQAALADVVARQDKDPAAMTIGVIGVGNVGSRVARSAALMGMRVLLNDPPRERVEGDGNFSPLEQILSEADIITLHVPLTFGGRDKTFHLVDDKLLRAVRKPAVLINTARGAVTDTDALKEAMQEGRIEAAVFDVWENEPHPDPELLSLAHLATPHIAGYSMEGKAMGSAMVIRAVSRHYGLGLDQWMPPVKTESREVEVNCEGRKAVEVLQEVFGSVFPIEVTSNALKKDPAAFEEMRRNYVFRPENSNFTLDLDLCGTGMTQLLRGWGFKLKSNTSTNHKIVRT